MEMTIIVVGMLLDLQKFMSTEHVFSKLLSIVICIAKETETQEDRALHSDRTLTLNHMCFRKHTRRLTSSEVRIYIFLSENLFNNSMTL